MGVTGHLYFRRSQLYPSEIRPDRPQGLSEYGSDKKNPATAMNTNSVFQSEVLYCCNTLTFELFSTLEINNI
jgi:hypothetical protein